MCHRKSGNGAGFPWVLQLLPVSVIPQWPTFIFILPLLMSEGQVGKAGGAFKPSNILFTGQKVLSHCFCSCFKELMNLLVPGYWTAVYLFELWWIFRCKMPCEEFHWQHGYLLIGLKVRFDSIAANTAHHWQQRCEEWIKCLMVTGREERTLVLQSCIQKLHGLATNRWQFVVEETSDDQEEHVAGKQSIYLDKQKRNATLST